jgi:glutamine amidotransferase-like uncharacterized protein
MMGIPLRAQLLLAVCAAVLPGAAGARLPNVCPITDNTRVVYSIVSGVGSGSKIWIKDFLTWWNDADPNLEYVALTSRDLQVNCNLKSFPNLRVYVNPGGDAYMQLSALGVAGTANIKDFINRDQSNPSAYVGICAGTYLASHDYIWETMFQGTDYYDFATNPPMSLFPHTVEGSIFDINDDQFGDQSGSKFRVVNVSNSQHMLYYGGSTFGYNGVPDYSDPSSPYYDEKIEVLIYYTDFYGHNSYNIPAAWRYGNMLLSSVHPEASNCTDQDDIDCPPEGTLPMEEIEQNWAWLASYVNTISQSSFVLPDVPIAPVLDTTAPHSAYPHKSCYDKDSSVLFCDDFDSESGSIPYGLAPQFQRNESDYQYSHPWNTSFITNWFGQEYTAAYEGDGYAVVVPLSFATQYSSIETKDITVSKASCPSLAVRLQFALKGKTVSSGYFSVEYRAGDDDKWSLISSAPLDPAMASWAAQSDDVSVSAAAGSVRFRFTCASGAAADN